MTEANVTVVIRSCGRASLLRRTLASLEAQTYPPKEIVIVAIGPVGEKAAASALLSRIVRVVPVPAGRVRGGALNDGIKAASMPWIAFLDDDDTWASTFVEEMGSMAKREDGPGFGGVVCQSEAVYERVVDDQAVPLGGEPFNPNLERLTPEALFRENRFTINAALWRRTVFAELGGFSEHLSVLEDWDFNLRAAVSYRLAVLPRRLARYHIRPRTDALPNTQMREHDRIATRLQWEWLRTGRLGEQSVAGRWRQACWLVEAMVARRRARFGAWRRWRAWSRS